MTKSLLEVFVLVFASSWPGVAWGFGNYLDPYQLKKRREQQQLEHGDDDNGDGDGQEIIETFALKDYSARHDTSGGSSRVDEDNHNDRTRDTVEIEVIAAILIAGIFAFFILVYTLVLQCWWKCRHRQKHSSLAKSTTAGSDSASHPNCACYAQTAWEPVDLEKCLAESEQSRFAAGANS